MSRIETKTWSKKALFQNRIDQLPEMVRRELGAFKGANGQVTSSRKVIDFELFSITKAAGQSNVKMFEESVLDLRQTNLPQGKMDSDRYFLVTSIVLATGTSATANSVLSDAVSLPFNALDPIVRNSKFVLRHGQEVIIENSSNGAFVIGNSQLEAGEMVIENPFFFQEKQSVRFDVVDLPAALAAETWLKVRFKGLMVVKR